MSATSSVFSVVFPGLLAAPVATPLMAFGVTRLPPGLQRWAYVLVAAIAALTGLACALEISFPNLQTNALAIIASLWAILTLLLSAYRLRSPWARHLIGASGLLLLVCSAFLATVGGLLTAFMVGDAVPVHASTEPSGRSCLVTSYGNATTDFGGYTVTITQPLRLAPFLEQAIWRKSYEKPRQGPAELCTHAMQ